MMRLWSVRKLVITPLQVAPPGYRFQLVAAQRRRIHSLLTRASEVWRPEGNPQAEAVLETGFAPNALEGLPCCSPSA